MLTTMRLTLRPFTFADAPAFEGLAGDWDVARMTSDIPHPLDADRARHWLQPATGEQRFAICRKGVLIGGAGTFRRESGVGELGFWLGRAWWGQGFATEAALKNSSAEEESEEEEEEEEEAVSEAAALGEV